MIEIMTASRKNMKITPLIGYNFDKDASTGKTGVTVTGGTAAITTVPVPVTGYSKALKTAINKVYPVTPAMDVAKIGTGDFTLELWLYLNYSGTDYVYLLALPYSSGGVTRNILIRFGNSGYGNRLSITGDSNSRDSIFSSADTKASLSDGKFHHIAFVRQGGMATLYVDGKARPTATGTNANSASDPKARALGQSFSNVGTFNIGDSTYGPTPLYIPDFALWDSAIYSADFTPIAPLVK